MACQTIIGYSRTFLDESVQVREFAQGSEIGNSLAIRHVLVELGLEVTQDILATSEFPEEVRQSR